MSDPTVGGEQPRRSPRAAPAAREEDPGALAKADVRAILGRALGLRRIVELAAETAAARSDAGPVDQSRPRRPRPI